MKKPLLTFAAVAFSVASFSIMAAQQLSPDQTGSLRKAGAISVHGAANLDDVQDKLAEKAREEGATGFVVSSAGGENKMYGTATLYK